ncbi:MAG: hypothetical protein M3Y72_06930 [Acidobacteriota bacterium]|nr:hypothetical protein [Acidobacteriota bacterium]
MKRVLTLSLLLTNSLALALAQQNDEGRALLSALPGAPHTKSSTIPKNGDLNPYGMAFVPKHFLEGGPLEPGDLLVSNFNASSNLQGTGTTIVRIGHKGALSLFFQSATPTGLTTALGVLRSGFVLVGNLPTTDGTSATVGQGSLIIIDRFGRKAGELKDKRLLDGPWDLAVLDEGEWAYVFVSNVLNGTVTRLTFQFAGDRFYLRDTRRIGSGYAHKTDPAALVIGPTGLAYERENGTLFVASTGDNEIFAIPDAKNIREDEGRGFVAIDDPVHLHGPLGLVITPGEHLIISNGDAINPDPKHFSELEEFSEDRNFLASYQVDTVAGAAFGVALVHHDDYVRFAAVDDNTNIATIWRVEH